METKNKTDGKTSKISYRTYAIKNHEVVCYMDTAPFSEEALNKLCEKEGFDGFIYLNPKTVRTLWMLRRFKINTH
jgi:hypothetical protein